MLGNSRTPGADRIGLGSAEPSQQSHTIGPFVPAVDTQPPVLMDCQPPSSAEVLPPVTQAMAMDIDAAPQPPLPSPSAMECDTQDSQLPCHQAASSLETQLAGVSMDLIDTCFEWLSVHTHHSVPASEQQFNVTTLECTDVIHTYSKVNVSTLEPGQRTTVWSCWLRPAASYYKPVLGQLKEQCKTGHNARHNNMKINQQLHVPSSTAIQPMSNHYQCPMSHHSNVTCCPMSHHTRKKF